MANPTLSDPMLNGPANAESNYQRSEREDDFLFHLHRGTELLKGDRVAEARRELEAALSRQPTDVQGQSLLGLVYFRLGLYAKAIPIYEQLEHQCPLEIPPKVNLALCYLKTSEVGLARVLLERVVTRAPEHQRAWGYLGLAYQRLGEFERAAEAFERGGQARLAAKAHEQAALSDPRAVPSADPSDVPFARSSLPMREIHDSGLLDEPELDFTPRETPPPLAPPNTAPAPSRGIGQKHSTKPAPPASDETSSVSLASVLSASAQGKAAHDGLPTGLRDWLNGRRLEADELQIAHQLSNSALSFQYSGVLHVKGHLVRGVFPSAAPATGPSEVVRASWTTDPLHRMLGSGRVLLDAAPHRLHAVQLQEPGLFLRSCMLVGFSGQPTIQRRALTRSPGDFEVTRALPTQHQATLLFVSKAEPQCIELDGTAPALVAAEWLLGWSGQLVIERAARDTSAPQLLIHGRGSLLLDLGFATTRPSA